VGHQDIVAEEIDADAFALARAKATSDATYLKSLAGMKTRVAQPELNADDTRALRDILRGHSITTMAAAYGLVLEGNVDREVVNELRIRMKEIDEEIIPLSDEEVDRIGQLASKKPAAMLNDLGDSIGDRIKAIEAIVPGIEGEALIAGLSAERDFARATSQELGEGLGRVSRELLLEKLVADSTTALDQARLLIAAVREPGFLDRMTEALTEWLVGLSGAEQVESAPASFASVKVDNLIAVSGEIGAKLQSALPLKTGVKIKDWMMSYGIFAIPAFLFLILLIRRLLNLRPEHPFHDRRFTFFIFILIPVQTLFAHNWLTLPYYINRAFSGTTVGDNFEFFSNLNPILIFVLTPLIAAATARSNPYRMMIWGTLVMAAPTFLLALPPSPVILIGYIVLMTIGEAMWQPRFLQLVAELAPEGKTGAYMGIGQLPWFLTKLVTGMYSGYFIASYVPKVGPQNPAAMWLIYAFIAMLSPIMLLAAKNWMGSYLEKRHT
jgi:hypothetical protein